MGPMISREKLPYHRLTQRPDGSRKRFAVAIGTRSEKCCDKTPQPPTGGVPAVLRH